METQEEYDKRMKLLRAEYDRLHQAWIDAFLAVEVFQYPEKKQEQVKAIHQAVMKFVEEHGVNGVSIHTESNMCNLADSIGFDRFNKDRYREGDLSIGLDSDGNCAWAYQTPIGSGKQTQRRWLINLEGVKELFEDTENPELDG